MDDLHFDFAREVIYPKFMSIVDPLTMVRKREHIEFIAGAQYAIDMLEQLLNNPEAFFDEEGDNDYE